MGGNTNEIIQRGLGGGQIAAGGVATFLGAPELGIPLIANGIKSEANPNPNQGPLQSSLQAAESAGGAAAGGLGGSPGSGALGGSGDIGSILDVTGTGAGAGASQLPISLTQGGGISPTSAGGIGNFNPQMLSQFLGGSQTPQAKPPMQPPAPPPPMPPRPPASIQNAGQQAATPMPQPAPMVPKPPMAPQQQNPMIQKLLQQLLGGSI